MKASDIAAIIFIAIIAFCIGWAYGENGNITRTEHSEIVQKYAAAIDTYRDYTKALEQSVEIPDVPSLKLLRDNVTNNELCDLPTDNCTYKIESVYRSLNR